MEITNNPNQTPQYSANTDSYSSQLRNKGLDEGRIKLLNEADGNDKDGIQRPLFDVARDIMDGLSRDEALAKYDEKTVNIVGQIMDLRIKEDPTDGLPMYIKPEDAMKELGISADQAGELARLNNNDPSKGIQRGFYQLAKKIIDKEPINDPSGLYSSKISAVQAILTNQVGHIDEE